MTSDKRPVTPPSGRDGPHQSANRQPRPEPGGKARSTAQAGPSKRPKSLHGKALRHGNSRPAPEESGGCLHELRVHQIQLEIKRELCRTQEWTPRGALFDLRSGAVAMSRTKGDLEANSPPPPSGRSRARCQQPITIHFNADQEYTCTKKVL